MPTHEDDKANPESQGEYFDTYDLQKEWVLLRFDFGRQASSSRTARQEFLLLQALGLWYFVQKTPKQN